MRSFLARSVLALALFVPAVRAASDCLPIFPSVSTFPVSTNPAALVTGRFNADDLPDIAVANRGGQSVSVLLNLGGRKFAPAVEYPASGPSGLKTADFNGDAILDLAIESRGNYGGVTVLLGRGDGTFYGNFGAGAAYCVSMTPGDFNGDGLADLATAQGTGVIGIHLNDGGAIFRSPRDSDATPNLVFMEAADLNGDGKTDLVGGDLIARTLILFRGNGDGRLERDVSFDFPEAPTFLKIADLDRDSRVDLLVSSHGHDSIGVLFGKGGGEFENPALFASGTYPATFALADFDRDGQIDLAGGNSFNESVTILRAKGNRAFELSVPYTVGGWPVGIAAEDFDGDGKMDVAVANDRTIYAPGAVSIAWGKDRGALDAPRQILPDYAASGLETRDMDKDGRPDLVLQSNGLLVLNGSGAGEFKEGNWQSIGYLTTGRAITADFNGDGISDFAIPTMTLPMPPFIPYPYYNALTMLGTTNRSWESRGAASLNSQATSLVAADFNSDSKQDLAVVYQYEQKVTVFLGKGDGWFQGGADYPLPSRAYGVAAVDANADGHPDLAVTTDSGTQLLIGSQSGALTAAPGAPVPLWSPAFADLNGDSKMDMVGVPSITNLTVALGNNDGTFTLGSEIPLRTYDARPVLTDLDGDHRTDLLVESSLGITVFMGNGDGTFRKRSEHPLGERPGSLSVADVTSDGRPDLIVISGLQQRRISIFENLCGGSAPSMSVSRQGDRIILSWPKSDAGAAQFSDSLEANSWQDLSGAPVESGDRCELSMLVEARSRYFRLRLSEPR